MNQPRNDPPPPPATEGDWFDNAELPRVEVPKVEKEKTEKERQEIIEIRGKIEKLERTVRKTYGIDKLYARLEGLFERVSEKLLEGFKMLEIDRFDGTGNPKNHVRICIRAF